VLRQRPSELLLNDAQEVLASHESLHTFRMLSYPDLDYITSPPPGQRPISNMITASEIRLYQMLIQNFINGVLRCLDKASSRLRVFSSDPSSRSMNSPAADMNGHARPDTYIVEVM
jgi:hypothetical protein